MSQSNNTPRKHPRQVEYEAGLTAAQRGDIESALAHYASLFRQKEFFYGSLGSFVSDVLSVGKAGAELVVNQRDECEARIRENRTTIYTFDNLILFNRSIGTPDRDIAFYQNLLAEPSSSVQSLLLILGVIIVRKEAENCIAEGKPFVEAFVQNLERLTEKPKTDMCMPKPMARIRKRCFRMSAQLDDAKLSARLIKGFLSILPLPSVYFELKSLAAKYGEPISAPLDNCYCQFSTKDKLRIVICECLNVTDPEGLVEMGAPLDEYAGEAQAILEVLKPNLSIDEFAESLCEIWKKKFGTIVLVRGDEIGGRHVNSDYVCPDLTQTAAKIFTAVSPFLSSLDEP